MNNGLYGKIIPPFSPIRDCTSCRSESGRVGKTSKGLLTCSDEKIAFVLPKNSFLSIGNVSSISKKNYI